MDVINGVNADNGAPANAETGNADKNADPNAAKAGSTSQAEGDENSGLADATPEELLKEIRALRAENAAKRVKAKAAESELEQYRAWKRSQMSDTERLQADLKSARDEAMRAYADVYAEKYGVPEERRRFITGTDKTEIEEACRVLGGDKPQAEGAQKSKPPVASQSGPALFPGTRGSALGSQNRADETDGFDSTLRARLRGA